ncbi:MAG: ATP-binding protein [Spirochaetaceae bacterium]|nr:ATP-binding protein [Spirochaetaceae bacterium]
MAPRTTTRKRASRARSGTRSSSRARNGGKLRIGDHWNAITIIALSQNSPLKAIAEFVENSIDANARNVTIVRGREQGEHYLRVVDDGEGIRLNQDGVPDFAYVATHICDSIKRTLKRQGAGNIQGEFGIGLLSFWTVGERLVLSSRGADGHAYEMEMLKGDQRYQLTRRRILFAQPGTELLVRPLLPGIRQLSAERIQGFLASELRERIRASGVRINIKDRRARAELEVVPREFTGRPLRGIEPIQTPEGTVEAEIYLNEPSADNCVALFRHGTRVVPDISRLPGLDREPWTTGLLQGLVEAPFLQLTPGTRDGVVLDARFEALCTGLRQIEPAILEQIERERAAAEEEASRSILRSVRKALTEGFQSLPREDYTMLEVPEPRRTRVAGADGHESGNDGLGELPLGADDPQQAVEPGPTEPTNDAEPSAPAPRKFYEHAGPLHKLTVSPASSVVKVGESCTIRCIPKDRSGRVIEAGVDVRWRLIEGGGSLADDDREVVRFLASDQPGLTVLQATAKQAESECSAEATVTVAESIGERLGNSDHGGGRGIPDYTYRHAPGELWRSRYDVEHNLIVVNNGHGDFRYAEQKRPRHLRYMLRLYAKELVLNNFAGYDPDQMLERMIELSLYTEEHLR